MVDHNKTSMKQSLQAIQGEYDAQLLGRMEEIISYISEIKKESPDSELLIRLHNVVHRLAGSGSTFGYHEMSSVAQEIECQIKPWIEESHIPVKSEIKKLVSLLEALNSLTVSQKNS